MSRSRLLLKRPAAETDHHTLGVPLKRARPQAAAAAAAGAVSRARLRTVATSAGAQVPILQSGDSAILRASVVPVSQQGVASQEVPAPGSSLTSDTARFLSAAGTGNVQDFRGTTATRFDAALEVTKFLDSLVPLGSLVALQNAARRQLANNADQRNILNWMIEETSPGLPQRLTVTFRGEAPRPFVDRIPMWSRDDMLSFVREFHRRTASKPFQRPKLDGGAVCDRIPALWWSLVAWRLWQDRACTGRVSRPLSHDLPLAIPTTIDKLLVSLVDEWEAALSGETVAALDMLQQMTRTSVGGARQRPSAKTESGPAAQFNEATEAEHFFNVPSWNSASAAQLTARRDSVLTMERRILGWSVEEAGKNQSPILSVTFRGDGQVSYVDRVPLWTRKEMLALVRKIRAQGKRRRGPKLDTSTVSERCPALWWSLTVWAIENRVNASPNERAGPWFPLAMPAPMGNVLAGLIEEADAQGDASESLGSQRPIEFDPISEAGKLMDSDISWGRRAILQNAARRASADFGEPRILGWQVEERAAGQPQRLKVTFRGDTSNVFVDHVPLWTPQQMVSLVHEVHTRSSSSAEARKALDADAVCNRCPALWWSLVSWALEQAHGEKRSRPNLQFPLMVPAPVAGLLATLVDESFKPLNDDQAEDDEGLVQDEETLPASWKTSHEKGQDQAVPGLGQEKPEAASGENSTASAVAPAATLSLAERLVAAQPVVGAFERQSAAELPTGSAGGQLRRGFDFDAATEARKLLDDDVSSWGSVAVSQNAARRQAAVPGERRILGWTVESRGTNQPPRLRVTFRGSDAKAYIDRVPLWTHRQMITLVHEVYKQASRSSKLAASKRPIINIDTVCNRCPALWWSLVAWVLEQQPGGQGRGRALDPPAAVPAPIDRILVALVSEAEAAIRPEPDEKVGATPCLPPNEKDQKQQAAATGTVTSLTSPVLVSRPRKGAEFDANMEASKFLQSDLSFGSVAASQNAARRGAGAVGERRIVGWSVEERGTGQPQRLRVTFKGNGPGPKSFADRVPLWNRRQMALLVQEVHKQSSSPSHAQSMLTAEMVCNRCPALWWSLAAWALGGRADDGSAACSAWKPPARALPLSVPESMESLLSNLVTDSMREERTLAEKAMQEDHTQASKDVETAPADSGKAVIGAGEADASAPTEEDALAQAGKDAEATVPADAEKAATTDSGKPVIRAGAADAPGPDCNLESDALAEAGKFLQSSDVA